MTIKTLISGELYFVEDQIGFSHKDLGTHSLKSGFYMDIFLIQLYQKTIMIIGRWSSNTFLHSIQILVRNSRKGISALVINTHIFYTITESEVIYYTLGKFGNQI